MRRLLYDDLRDTISSCGFCLLTTESEFRSTGQRLTVRCRCGRTIKKFLSNIKRDGGCHGCGHSLRRKIEPLKPWSM